MIISPFSLSFLFSFFVFFCFFGFLLWNLPPKTTHNSTLLRAFFPFPKGKWFSKARKFEREMGKGEKDEAYAFTIVQYTLCQKRTLLGSTRIRTMILTKSPERAWGSVYRFSLFFWSPKIKKKKKKKRERNEKLPRKNPVLILQQWVDSVKDN